MFIVEYDLCLLVVDKLATGNPWQSKINNFPSSFDSSSTFWIHPYTQGVISKPVLWGNDHYVGRSAGSLRQMATF